MKITIDTDKLTKLKQDGEKIIFEAEAEKSIMELLDIQEKLEKIIDQLKADLAEEALDYDKNFKSIESDNLRIMFRKYGGRYKIDKTRIKEVSRKLYRVNKRYYPENDEIDKWADENDGLPLGVIERDRSKKLSITLKGRKNA